MSIHYFATSSWRIRLGNCGIEHLLKCVHIGFQIIQALGHLVGRSIGAHGVGVERTFFMHSPRLEKIEVISHAHVRRAQLYYLRGRTGKAARLREKRIDTRKHAATETEAAAE